MFIEIQVRSFFLDEKIPSDTSCSDRRERNKHREARRVLMNVVLAVTLLKTRVH